MKLSRYAAQDSYVLEELRRDYQSSDAKGRIRLLKKVYRQRVMLPFEIAQMAVVDPQVEVRQWIARFGKYLDYSDKSAHGGEAHADAARDKPMEIFSPSGDVAVPERNLILRLKEDRDPFVRACLRENPNFFSSLIRSIWGWEQYFREATHFERLALMRNPAISESEMVTKLFDPDDKELEIDLQERKELILAYLTNAESLKHSSPDEQRSSWPTGHWNTLWALASKWPTESGVPYSVFLNVGVDDKTKAKLYPTIEAPLIRRLILQNCTKDDKKTVRAGMKDDDADCRCIACSKVEFTYDERKLLEGVLNSSDGAALSGLTCNTSLSVEDLLAAAGRLSELKDEVWESSAWKTIEQIEERTPPEEPDELFGWQGRRGDFTQDKLDWIWKRLEVNERLTESLVVSLKNLHQLQTVLGWIVVVTLVVLLAHVFR